MTKRPNQIINRTGDTDVFLETLSTELFRNVAAGYQHRYVLLAMSSDD